VTGGGRVVRLATWEIPLELADGEVVVARGATRWQPDAVAAAAAGPDRRLVGALGGVLLLALAAGVVARRGRVRRAGAQPAG
jgi:hypothetical protein